jgi:hypothetical protein
MPATPPVRRSNPYGRLNNRLMWSETSDIFERRSALPDAHHHLVLLQRRCGKGLLRHRPSHRNAGRADWRAGGHGREFVRRSAAWH